MGSLNGAILEIGVTMAGISKEERFELLRAIKAADANFEKGMYALAEPTYRKGVECLGDGAAEITGCLKNLAHICAERKDFDEALKLDIQLLLLSEERFGESHVKTIALMDEIAGLYEKLGRSDESRDMYERARKASERSLWADQSNEPDGVQGPAELAEELDLGYQYSDTAKSALETAVPKPGEINYEFGAPQAEPKKRELAEETMKLPKIRDEDLEKRKKDPQLETLILDRSEIKKSLEKKDDKSDLGNGAGVNISGTAPGGADISGANNSGAALAGATTSDTTPSDTIASASASVSATGSAAKPASSDILKKMKSKLELSGGFNIQPQEDSKPASDSTAAEKPQHSSPSKPDAASSLKLDAASSLDLLINAASRGASDPSILEAVRKNLDSLEHAPSSPSIKSRATDPATISVEQTVIDAAAPSNETPEIISGDAIKAGAWKSDAAISKTVLGNALKQEAKEKLEPGPELVVKSPTERQQQLAHTDDSSKKDAATKKKEPTVVKLFQSDKQRNWILGIFIGCFALLLLTSLFTSHANTKEDYRNMAHRYRTVDGEKLFFLTSPSECEFVAGADTAKMPYYQHHGDFLDTWRIVFGPLLHHPHWLTRQKNTIVDEQGSPLYAEASPELSVTDFAEEIGKAAQLAYLKTKHYPKNLNELEVSKRAYHNPFTGQLDKPNIQNAILGKKTQADDGGIRRKWFDTTLNGNRWPNESKRHAGGINCYSVIIHTKKGDLNSFYIRPFDKDGKPFVGSEPQLIYGIILENGANKSSPRPNLSFHTNTIRPHRAWLMPPMNSSVLFLLKHGAAIVIMLVAFALWIFSQAARPNQTLSTILKVLMIASLGLLLIYLLTGVLP
ncbi:MAG: tetratricopeptide repeat protein [Candidatus Obscuribacterales bacterium]